MSAARQPLPQAEDGAPPPAESMRTGARLRAAREAAGLSLEQVAEQLKLAPRQVRAMEEESFDELPGRTFSRGFVRNYARLLGLDALELLARLPDNVQAPLQGPSLSSTATTMAELPAAASKKAGIARWLIPLALIACVAAAAAYEWYRGGFTTLSERQQPLNEPQRKPIAAASLPNPLTSPVTPANEAAAPNASAAQPDKAPNEGVATAAVPAAVPQGDAPLVLTYRGPSWTEIRDRNGQVLVSRLVAANSVEPVRGDAPFDIVLGNARVVSVTYLGKTLDLTPYANRNIVRVRLP